MEEELTIAEVQKLAKHYGEMAKKGVIPKEDSIELWEVLSYCRGIILKHKNSKDVN